MNMSKENHKSLLHFFPVELIVKIFSSLDQKDLCHCCRVSLQWCHIAYDHPSLWKRLTLSNSYSLGGDKHMGTATDRIIIDTCSNTQIMNEGTNASLYQLLTMNQYRFSHLSKLELSYTNVELSLFEQVGIVSLLSQTLTDLYIDGCSNVDSNSLFHLRYLTSLKNLDISHCTLVDDVGLDVISYILPQLQSLNLSYIFRITEKGVSKLFKMPHLTSVNLLGCYRIRSYPWALLDRKKKGVTGIKELMLGEDSRIHTGGFWLLWCCWNWSMTTLVNVCPLLQVLRVNMVLFDLPGDSLTILLKGCKYLKHLGLILDRSTVSAMCDNAEALNKLQSLELTCHIGITVEQMNSLIQAGCLKRLKTMKFHSKQTLVFTDANVTNLIKTMAPPLEYLEMNTERTGSDTLKWLPTLIHSIPLNSKDAKDTIRHDVQLDSPSTAVASTPLSPIDTTSPQTACNSPSEPTFPTLPSKPTRNTKILQTVLLHNVTLSNETMDTFANGLIHTRELALSNLKQTSFSNRLSCLVGIKKNKKGANRDVKEKSKKATPPLHVKIPKSIEPMTLSKKLRKIEISSAQGFSDKDLSFIPRHCTLLQWIDFSFHFTFPETMKEIALHCDQLLYLKLCRYSPNARAGRRNIGGMVGIPSNRTTTTTTTRTTTTTTTAATTGRELALARPQEAVAPPEEDMEDELSILIDSFRGSSHRNVSCIDKKKDPDALLASSPECKSFVFFGKKGPKSLRMLDLAGNLGLTDWTLSTLTQVGAQLHTLFIESCPSLTSKGLTAFAESRWKHLKRINIRHCPRVQFSVTEENFLSKSLEIEVVADGARLGNPGTNGIFSI